MHLQFRARNQRPLMILILLCLSSEYVPSIVFVVFRPTYHAHFRKIGVEDLEDSESPSAKDPKGMAR